MLITIVTVCRNDLQGLRRTFDSIQAQDYLFFEWWVIDGASSDGTKEWLEKNHVLPGGWISEQDRGIYDAMNKGTERSKGEYLVYMNSGDAFAATDVVSKIVKCIENETAKPDLLFGDALDTLGDGRVHYRPAISLSRILFSMPTRHQSMFFRRKCLGASPYPASYPLSGDYALTAILSKRRGLNVTRVNFPICLFSLGGIHDTRRLDALKEDYAIRRDILKANLIVCYLYYTLHIVHHSFRRFFPNLNKKLVYDT